MPWIKTGWSLSYIKVDKCASAAFACCLSIFCMKKKFSVIGLIENGKNFFMKRKFMDSAEVTLKFVGL